MPAHPSEVRDSSYVEPAPLSEDNPLVEEEETQDVRVEESSEDTSMVCDLCNEISEEGNYHTNYSVEGVLREAVCDDCMSELYLSLIHI